MGSQLAGSSGEEDSGATPVRRDDYGDSSGAEVLKRLAFIREARDVVGNRKPSLVVTGFKLRGGYHGDYSPSLLQPR